MLGVGQSGGRDVQFSLFDIGDPASPRRIDTQTYGGGAAAAEFDPRAFLYWAPRDLVIAPVTLYGKGDGQDAFSGTVLLRADRDRLTQSGRIAVPADHGTAHRSVVIGNAVYTLSDRALQVNRLDDQRRIDELVL